MYKVKFRMFNKYRLAEITNSYKEALKSAHYLSDVSGWVYVIIEKPDGTIVQI